jgi:lincosamide nucleotidyltransferase A/C/D/E
MDARETLAVIELIVRADMRHVVSGGWGIDALVGRQTRNHDDLDLGVDSARIDEAIALLRDEGYSVVVDQRPARIEISDGAERRVDLHPIEWDADGNGLQRGFDGRTFNYPAADVVVGYIGGRAIACISARLQREFHSGYAPRETDPVDLAKLDKVEAMRDVARHL